MVFYTPKEKPMMLEEVRNAGYGVSMTPTRLVLRSPYNTPETYIEDVRERVKYRCVSSLALEIFWFSVFFHPGERGADGGL